MMVIPRSPAVPIFGVDWVTRPFQQLASFVRSAVPNISQPTSVGTQRFDCIDDWTSPARTAVEADTTPSAMLAEIRGVSGLTWAEVATLTGVSARTLHYWMNGGATSDPHRRRLSAIAAVVDQLRLYDRGYIAEALRTQFAPPESRSVTDYRPLDLMTSLVDSTQHGTNAGVELNEF
jgi:transcriptional regulator with XRE-family HTH domain